MTCHHVSWGGSRDHIFGRGHVILAEVILHQTTILNYHILIIVAKLNLYQIMSLKLLNFDMICYCTELDSIQCFGFIFSIVKLSLLYWMLKCWWSNDEEFIWRRNYWRRVDKRLIFTNHLITLMMTYQHHLWSGMIVFDSSLSVIISVILMIIPIIIPPPQCWR